MKLLCILLPHFLWRCEVHRRPELEGRPSLVAQVTGSQKLVLDYSPGLAGLRRDMPLQQALSLNGEVTILQADIPWYRSVFNEILDQLETISPLVEGPELGQAYLGMDGMQLIYPNEAALAADVRAVIPESFTVQMGIAEGKFPAYLTSLGSPSGGYQILTGDAGSFLQNLSCDVLPVSRKSKDRLSDFGIRTLGQLASLPAGPLQSQFGPEGKRMRDLAHGCDETPLYPRFMEENIEESIVLSQVTVSLDAILLAVEALLARVFARDSLKGRGIRRLTLWTRGWSSQHWEQSISCKEPAMNIPQVVSRIRPFLENSPQPGPVEQVGINITGLGYRSGRQKSIFSEVRDRDRLIDDIKHLDLRLGGHQVFRIKEVEPWSRIPERRYVLMPVSR